MAGPTAQFRAAPGTPLVDVPNLMEALGVASDQDKETARLMQEQFRAMGEATSARAAASREGTLGNTFETPQTILFRDNEQLAADTQKKAAMAAAGFNPDAASSVANIMIQDIRDAGMKMRAVTNDLAAAKAVNLFDNPIQAIVNAFAIPWKEQELQGLVSEQANRKKTLDDLTSSVTNVAASAEAGMAKVSAATIADRQRALARNQDAAALAIEESGMKYGIDALKEVQNASGRQLDRVRMATQFYNDVQTQKRADEHLAISRRELVLREEAALEAARVSKDKEAEKAIITNAESEMFRLANKARLNDGLLPYRTVGELKSRMLMTKGERERVEDFVERGRRLENPRTAGTYQYGPTATEAISYLRENGLAPTTPAERQFEEVVLAAVAEEKKYKDTKGVGGTGALTFRRDFVKANWERYKSGDASNPNAPITFEALAADPAVAANPIFQRVIAPQITDGNRKLSAEPNQIFAMVTDGLINERVNPAAAAELIRTIYNKSTELNNKNTQIFKWMGYQPEKLVTDVYTGMSTTGEVVGSAVFGTAAALGVAMIATGAGALPGAAIAAGATAAEAKLLNSKTMRVDLSDATQIQLALTKSVQAKLGITLTKTGPGGGTLYPSGGSAATTGMPGPFESSRILQGK